MTEQDHFVSVALPVPSTETFVYSVPKDLVSAAGVGFRALVPFGKRLLTGFIVGVSDDPGDVPIEKIRPIQDILDDEPAADSGMIELAGWVADYYLSSTGEVLKSAAPAGTNVRSRLRVHPEENAPDVPLTPLQEKIIGFLRAHGPSLLRVIEREMGGKTAAAVRALERKGVVRLEREMTAPAARVKTERRVMPLPDGPEIPSRAKKQAECLAALRDHPEGVALTEFMERYGFTRGVVNALVEAGAAAYEEVEVTRRARPAESGTARTDHPLTSSQVEAVRLVRSESEAPNPRPVLLFGVTGSGKTRVYIELVRDALQAGRGALILVPEIALTPQTSRFFASVFPGRIAVLHSAMSPGERFDSWRLIRDGSLDVVIGPRSAVFAPVKSPGVIIVDEEHDPSYKQTDSAPRYHARDVAVVRARMLGIPAVLGSATPSLESWRNATGGKYLLARLPERVESRPLPAVECVDMREEWKAGNHSSLSIHLREALTDRIERGEKSIILLNRRGFATGIRCRDCGRAVQCPTCSAGLVYHASKRLAVCHLCGGSRVVLDNCPSCGAPGLIYGGKGTQRIERELAGIYESAGIVRMDSDSTTAHDAHRRLIDEFRTGPASILVGTQMVGKGHDIAEVSLVGVIAADAALSIPDFRAAERAFQLITQVAGRAGRGDAPGTVIVQTHAPDHYAVRAACAHDFETFAQRELEEREEVGFPPFMRLVLIELASEDRRAVIARSEEAAVYLVEHVPPGTEVLGPVEAPVARVRGRYRFHILVKTSSPAQLRPILRGFMQAFQGPETIIVDVDPVDMM